MNPGQCVWNSKAAPPGDRTAPGRSSAAAAMTRQYGARHNDLPGLHCFPAPEEIDPIALTARCVILPPVARDVCVPRPAPGESAAISVSCC